MSRWWISLFFLIIFFYHKSDAIIENSTARTSPQNMTDTIQLLLKFVTGNFGVNKNVFLNLATNGYISQAYDWVKKSLSMDSLFGDLLPNNISVNCRRDLSSFVSAIASGDQLWPWEMLDSLGKPPSGLLKGNIVWAGNFWQCLNIAVKNKSTIDNQQLHRSQFVGEYCLLKFVQLFDNSLTTDQNKDSVSFAIGVCWPSTCSHEDKNRILNYYLQGVVTTAVTEKYCQTAEREEMSYSEVLLTLMVLFPLGLVLIGTTLDFYYSCYGSQHNGKKNNLPTEICGIFSARNSLKSLYTTYSTDDTGGNVITCIFGIRCIVMIAVIWVHVLSMNLDDFPWQNGLEYVDIFKYPLAHLCAQSFAIISSFFVVSGFCLSYSSVVAEKRQNGAFSVIRCYVNRYIRIMPMYYYMIAFNGGLFYYLWKGPFWPLVSTIKNQCQTHFWRKLLNFENLFSHWENDGECVTGEWFLGADWQLYLVAVPLVLLMMKKPRSSFYCIIAGMFVTTAVWIGMKMTTPTFSLFYGLSKSRMSSRTQINSQKPTRPVCIDDEERERKHN
ncbi:hypothetical protein CHUAL_003021 [Chamberlinius hualienensis]